jgi:hypothetical protein
MINGYKILVRKAEGDDLEHTGIGRRIILKGILKNSV